MTEEVRIWQIIAVLPQVKNRGEQTAAYQLLMKTLTTAADKILVEIETRIAATAKCSKTVIKWDPPKLMFYSESGNSQAKDDDADDTKSIKVTQNFCTFVPTFYIRDVATDTEIPQTRYIGFPPTVQIVLDMVSYWKTVCSTSLTTIAPWLRECCSKKDDSPVGDNKAA